jgi:hypothetical protein
MRQGIFFASATSFLLVVKEIDYDGVLGLFLSATALAL